MTFSRAFTILALVASLNPCVFSAPSGVVSPAVAISSVDVKTQRRSLLSLSSSSTTNTNAYVNTFNGCQSASAGLGSLVNGTVGGLVGSVVNDVVDPTLSKVATLIDNALPTLKQLVKCTDATVATTVYQAFATWASLQVKIFAAITVSASQLSNSVRAAALPILVHLQASIQSLLIALFNYIPSDLDKLYLSASISLRIQNAITACS